MRTHLLLLLVGFACPGCTVGQFDEERPGEAQSNAPDAQPTPLPSSLPCAEPQAGNGDGEHNPGGACIDCHVREDEGPVFTLSGTLYSDVAGTSPLAGATLHFLDANGEEITLTTARNGNFYTTQEIAFPVTTYASACPDALRMVTPVAQADGDCNKGGCHAEGFRIWLGAQ